MLENYLQAIVTFIATLAAVAIVSYFRNRNKKDDEKVTAIKNSEVFTHKDENKDEKNFFSVPEKKEIKEVNLKSLNGKEEGNFGDYENLSNNKVNMKHDTAQKGNISKRDVPPHAKISKKNFQEFAGTRILVAEDNLINQKVIQGLLSDSGIDVVMADDGQNALDILQNDNHFNIILMDAHMPRLDGFETTRIIRANPAYSHIVVVALSGDTASDDIKKMIDAGMEEQLEKPLRMDALYDVIYAYTGEKEENNSDDFIEIIVTKELDGIKGLGVCGGDERFYREILNEFVTTYSDSSEKIYELLQENQMQEVDKLLLDIIGISANIGADSLKEVAINLKDALLDTEEKSYLTLAQMYEGHLQRLLKDIKDYL
jgi:CheY-like chemotaxis protein